MSLGIGVRVSVRGETGTVRYVGLANFAEGFWVGVELDKPLGKHRGTVGGTAYFECSAPDGLHGVFVREKLAVPLQKDPLTVQKIVEKLLRKLHAAHSDIKTLQARILLLESAEQRVEELATENEYLQENSGLIQASLDQLRADHSALAADHKLALEELALYAEMESEARSLLGDQMITSESALMILERNKFLEAASNLARLAHQKEIELLRIESDTYGALKDDLDHTIHSRDSLQNQLDDASLLIRLLQAQLDAALDLERVISHLSAENTELTDEINELRSTVNDLSELHDLEKSFEASQHQVECDLRQELAEHRTIIDSNKRLIQDLQRKNQSWALQASPLQVVQFLPDRKPDLDASASIRELELLRTQVETLESLNNRNAVAAACAAASERMARTNLEAAGLPTSLYDAVITKSLVSSLSKRCRLLAAQTECRNIHVLPFYVHVFGALELLLDVRYAHAGYIRVSQTIHNLISDVNKQVERAIQSYVEHGVTVLEYFHRFPKTMFSLLSYEDGGAVEYRLFRTMILAWFEYRYLGAIGLISQLHDLAPALDIAQQTQLNDIVDRLSSLKSSISIGLERVSSLEFNTILLECTKLDWSHELDHEWQDIGRACEIAEKGGALPQLNFDKDLEVVNRWQIYCDSLYRTATQPYQCLEEAVSSAERSAAPLASQLASACEELLAKDKMVHDLQLAIEYLEATLESRHSHLTEEVTRLKSELEEALRDYALVQEQLAAVQLEAQALRKQIDQGQPSALPIGGNRMAEYGLSDMRTQIERTRFSSEIKNLKNLARHALESHSNSAHTIMPLCRYRPIVNKSGVRLAQCAVKLRSIASTIRPVGIDGGHYTWKPMSQNPRFTHLRSQHQLAEYHAARDRIHDI